MSKKKNNKNKNTKKKLDTTSLVMGTILVLIFGLGVFAFVSNIVEKSDLPDELTYDNETYIGEESAPVKVVKFGDIKCPACMMWEHEVFPQLEKDYIDSGDVTFYFKNMTFLGPDSITAAQAGESVFAQNPESFRDFYKAVYKYQGPESEIWATTDNLVEIAKAEVDGIDYDKLRQDIENEVYLEEVEQDNKEAQGLGVVSTPTIFVNGKKVQDPFDYKEISSLIEKSLEK